jgi:hypothetical protein
LIRRYWSRSEPLVSKPCVWLAMAGTTRSRKLSLTSTVSVRDGIGLKRSMNPISERFPASSSANRRMADASETVHGTGKMAKRSWGVPPGNG